jgi:hypothetical protein
MVPSSPLALAIGKVKGIMINHLLVLLDEAPDELTLSAAKAEISFLLAIALFENSLASILRILELLLRCSWLSFVDEVKYFWKIISSVELDLSKASPVLVLDILQAVHDKSSADTNIFPVTSLSDAEILSRWIQIFGLFEEEKHSPEFAVDVGSISGVLCSLSAKLLQMNVLRVIPVVDMEKRFDILGPISVPLKISIDRMISNSSRDPLHGIAYLKQNIIFFFIDKMFNCIVFFAARRCTLVVYRALCQHQRRNRSRFFSSICTRW